MAERHHQPGLVVPRLMVGVLALLLGTAAIARADPDPWWGRDKALHFSVSAGLAGGGYGAMALVTEKDDRRWRVAGGVGLALAAGVGKEVADHYGAGDASWRDLTWDVIGTATGVGIAWLIDRVLFSRTSGSGS